MPDKTEGILITIEGIDGVGKSTQARMLADYLADMGHDVIRLREPTEGHWGKKIKNQTKHGRTITPKEECRWFLKDRMEDVENNIRPALEDGKIIILDRYYHSTMAYQGALGLSVERIREENERFAPKPDLVIILDAPPEISLRRIAEGRKEKLNFFETVEYQKKVRAIFLSMKDPDNVQILDGSMGLEEVQAGIRKVVDELLSEKDYLQPQVQI